MWVLEWWILHEGEKINSMSIVLQKKQCLGLSCASVREFVWIWTSGTFSSGVKWEMECYYTSVFKSLLII